MDRRGLWAAHSDSHSNRLVSLAAITRYMRCDIFKGLSQAHELLKNVKDSFSGGLKEFDNSRNIKEPPNSEPL